MKTIKRQFIIVAPIIFALAGISLFFAPRANPDGALTPLAADVREAGAPIPLDSVIIADTEELQRTGLSGRASLDPRSGMLFVFDRMDRHNIWMKDMLFPIDIIWLDGNLKVVHVEKNVSPETYDSANPSESKIFDSEEKSLFVLEVNAGMAEKNNYTEGNPLGFLSQYIYMK